MKWCLGGVDLRLFGSPNGVSAVVDEDDKLGDIHLVQALLCKGGSERQSKTTSCHQPNRTH